MYIMRVLMLRNSFVSLVQNKNRETIRIGSKEIRGAITLFREQNDQRYDSLIQRERRDHHMLHSDLNDASNGNIYTHPHTNMFTKENTSHHITPHHINVKKENVYVCK
jgi:hypothetical protein